MIVDAGGGTVDISSYALTSTTPIAVEEIATAECKSLLLMRDSMRSTANRCLRYYAGLYESECKGG